MRGRKSKYTASDAYNAYVAKYRSIEKRAKSLEAPLATKEAFMDQLEMVRMDYKARGINPPSLKKMAEQVARETAYSYSSGQAKAYQALEYNLGLDKRSVTSLRTKGLSNEERAMLKGFYSNAKASGIESGEIYAMLSTMFGSV